VESDPLNTSLIRGQIRSQLGPDEDLNAVMVVAVHLAERRARLLNRDPTSDDLRFALSIFCYWPFKTPPPEETAARLVQTRVPLFRAAAAGDFTALDQAVPESTLIARTGQLAQLQQRGVETFLRVRRRD
jgi:hypothetical protein